MICANVPGKQIMKANFLVHFSFGDVLYSQDDCAKCTSKDITQNKLLIYRYLKLKYIYAKH